MSQTQQTPQAKKSPNNPSIITFFICGNGKICVVSIVSPDGKTYFFGNGIGKIVPMNRITKKCDVPTPEEKPQGKPVHVFMNGQSGVVFTMTIAE